MCSMKVVIANMPSDHGSHWLWYYQDVIVSRVGPSPLLKERNALVKRQKKPEHKTVQKLLRI